MTDDEPMPKKQAWWAGAFGKWMLAGLILVLLIASFYFEENARGAAAWTQAQADITAAGESLDPNKFIPPPIPDDQNFGALPIFRLEPDSASSSAVSSLTDAPMKRALAHVDTMPSSPTDNQGRNQLPYLGDWSRGEVTDVVEVRKKLAELCKKNSLPVTDTMPLSEMFGLLCPSLAEPRAENAKRPLCQFLHADWNRLPFERSLACLTSQIKLAQVFAYQEKLALLDHQPQLAFDDLKVEWKINAGLGKEPILVAELVSLGVVAIQLGAIEQGLATHVWNDRHLAELENDLAQIDDLQECQLSLRGENVVFMIPTSDYLKKHRALLLSAFGGGGFPASSDLLDQIKHTIVMLITYSIPDGWIDQFKSDIARVYLLGAVKTVDPVAHRAFPDREQATVRQIRSTNGSQIWCNLVESMTSPVTYSGKKFAYAQTLVDEARIACQLERYRLAHGQYPEALSDLAPAQLPNDVMNGLPYHYERLHDGTYLLYSVAWNQVDDKGRLDKSGDRYEDTLDWVWPNHPRSEKSK